MTRDYSLLLVATLPQLVALGVQVGEPLAARAAAALGLDTSPHVTPCDLVTRDTCTITWHSSAVSVNLSWLRMLSSDSSQAPSYVTQHRVDMNIV